MTAKERVIERQSLEKRIDNMEKELAESIKEYIESERIKRLKTYEAALIKVLN